MPSPISSSAPRVFVCDNHEHVTRVLTLWLRRSGYDVATFEDGLDTWDALQMESPAALICDSEMPYMDGLELCRRLRNDFRFRDLPILLLGDYGHQFDEAALRKELQISAVLSKPLNPVELLFFLRRCVGSAEEETAC